MPLPLGDDEDEFDRDQDGIEDHWDLLLRCWDQLERLCRRCCRGRYDLVEEMMERVVDVMPQVVEAWDPTFGVPLRAHMFGSVRWYLWKYLNRRMKREVEGRRTLDYDPEGRPPEVDADAIEEVQVLMAGLADWQRYILEARVMRGLTFPQIAAELGVSRGRAKQYYERAVDEVRASRQLSADGVVETKHPVVGDPRAAIRAETQAAGRPGEGPREAQLGASRRPRAAARRVPLSAHVARWKAMSQPTSSGQP